LDEPRGRLLLDVIRNRAHQTGTKEGCREGDCGACSVLVGRVNDGELNYEVVTSCLVPLGEMQGCHVVTVEGTNVGDELNAVQHELVQFGGTQCGYCTPGFVVSLVGYLLSLGEDSPSRAGVEHAISGCLCRCTGYNSILRAGDALVERVQSGDLAPLLNADDPVAQGVKHGLLPDYFLGVQKRLEAIPARDEPAPSAGDVIIAGGTDLYVQRGDALNTDEGLNLFARYPEAKGIREAEGFVHIGALTTFTEFVESAPIRALVPRMDDYVPLLASLAIRNRATLGGNVVNASPIGDVTQFLLGLGARVVLRQDDSLRVLPLEELYLGYKSLDLRPGEFVSEFVLPAATSSSRFNFEKVSKRKALDISSVCGAARFEVNAGGEIVAARIALGGVAAIPLLCRETSDALVGPVSVSSIQHALVQLDQEIAPISDVRGSADYKRRLSRHIVLAHLAACFPDLLDPQSMGALL
ncbi:MAG: FAD binding domain-containing protein, partial [Myxococcota bacterium]